jgi:polar amino acid transport system substrate-binding protein
MEMGPVTIDETTRTKVAPKGVLRVGIAVGSAVSAVWTARDATTGDPRGPTVDLARRMAESLGLPLTLVEFASSGEIIDAAARGSWDVAFTPVDAERKKVVEFGPNYFLGESTYMVPKGSTVGTLEDVDRNSMRVYGVENTATIRSARRTLKNTTAIGLSSLDQVLEKFRNGEADAIALGTESLRSLQPEFPGARILDGHFHAAGTAVAVPLGHADALTVFSAILEELKADGTVRQIFDSHGMTTATVAPAGSRS